MILEQTGQPLDIIQTYSHANLQNNTLPAFLPHFENVAKVPIVMNASPLNMRLLTKTGAPQWHPAPEGMQECTRGLARDIPERAKNEGLADVGIEDLAVSFGMREFETKDSQGVSITRSAPVVVGVSSLEEVRLSALGHSRALLTVISNLTGPHRRQVLPRGKKPDGQGTGREDEEARDGGDGGDKSWRLGELELGVARAQRLKRYLTSCTGVIDHFGYF